MATASRRAGVVSSGPATVLIRNAEVDGRGGIDVCVGRDRIQQSGRQLTHQASDQVLDAAGGAAIPGLHDHHAHFRAVVAGRSSVDASTAADRAAFDELVASAAQSAGGGWLRVTGWVEHRRVRWIGAGWMRSRARFRRACSTGAPMSLLNSAALQAVGADDCDLTGVERDQHGAATGRLLRWMPGCATGWPRRALAQARARSGSGSRGTRPGAHGSGRPASPTPRRTGSGGRRRVCGAVCGRVLPSGWC